VHDEIQVYNAEIAEVGQRTYPQHLNYAAIGQIQPEFPGGFTSNHSLQGTPEFAYGLTEWWEAGFYLPFAVTGTGEFLSDGAKIPKRNLHERRPRAPDWEPGAAEVAECLVF
jgi:hypothetical protein